VAMSAVTNRNKTVCTYYATARSDLSAAAATAAAAAAAAAPATAARRLLYIGSGGDERPSDPNHPTLRDEAAFTNGRFFWRGFDPLVDIPRELLLATLGQLPTVDGAPSPAALPAHSGLTPAARASTGVRLITFAHEANVLWMSRAGGQLDAQQAGVEVFNSGIDVFGFGSSSAGGNVRAPHGAAAGLRRTPSAQTSSNPELAPLLSLTGL